MSLLNYRPYSNVTGFPASLLPESLLLKSPTYRFKSTCWRISWALAFFPHMWIFFSFYCVILDLIFWKGLVQGIYPSPWFALLTTPQHTDHHFLCSSALWCMCTVILLPQFFIAIWSAVIKPVWSVCALSLPSVCWAQWPQPLWEKWRDIYFLQFPSEQWSPLQLVHLSYCA